MYVKHDGPGLDALARNNLGSRDSGRCRLFTVARRPRKCLRNGLAPTSLPRGAARSSTGQATPGRGEHGSP
jgi:hypothetical protein